VPRLRGSLKELRRTVELLDEAFSGQALESESFAARAAEKARQTPTPDRRETMSHRLRPTFRTAAAIAAALLIGVGLVALLSRPRSDGRSGSAVVKPVPRRRR